MAVRLTDTAISKAVKEAAASGLRRDLSDVGEPGLRLRLTPPTGRNPDGTKAWVLACRDRDGRMRRFQIGDHPAIGISEARTKARELRLEVKAGADPIAESRKRRAITQGAREGVGTLKALLDLYGGPLPPKRGVSMTESGAPQVKPIGPGLGQKSWPTARARIDRVFKKMLGRPLANLSSGELQMEADAYASAQIAASAVRCLRPVVKWGAGRGYVADTVAQMKPPALVRRRDRVLSRAELAALLPHLCKSKNPYFRAFAAMLLTLARREEVAGARWKDVDLEANTWRFPITKNGLEHIVPLSHQAAALLREIGPGKPEDFIFANSAGGRLANWDRETKAAMKVSKTTGWTRHDLRRTGATLLGELGTDPHVIEAALNHTAVHSSLASVYNQARYRPQVRTALQLLADRLDGIGAGGAEVVLLSSRGA